MKLIGGEKPIPEFMSQVLMQVVPYWMKYIVYGYFKLIGHKRSADLVTWGFRKSSPDLLYKIIIFLNF